MVTQLVNPNNRAAPTPINPIEVVEEARADWRKALEAAERRALTAERARAWSAGGITMTGYRVDAAARAGHWRPVTVSRDDEGAIWTTCECEAGLRGLPCPHAAVALEAERAWPFDPRADGEDEARHATWRCWHCGEALPDGDGLARHLIFRHNAALGRGRGRR